MIKKEIYLLCMQVFFCFMFCYTRRFVFIIMILFWFGSGLASLFDGNIGNRGAEPGNRARAVLFCRVLRGRGGCVPFHQIRLLALSDMDPPEWTKTLSPIPQTKGKAPKMKTKMVLKLNFLHEVRGADQSWAGITAMESSTHFAYCNRGPNSCTRRYFT